MPTTNLGRIGYVDEGLWQVGVTYKRLSVVEHDSAVYSCVVPTTTAEPGAAGVTDWRLFITAPAAGGVSYTPYGNIVATNIQNAINELEDEKAKLAGDAAQVFSVDTATDANHAMPKSQVIAANVPNTPAGNIAATNVQEALNELDTEKAAKAGDAAQVFSGNAATEEAHLVNKATLAVLLADDTFAVGAIGFAKYEGPTAGDLISLGPLPSTSKTSVGTATGGNSSQVLIAGTIRVSGSINISSLEFQSASASGTWEVIAGGAVVGSGAFSLSASNPSGFASDSAPYSADVPVSVGNYVQLRLTVAAISSVDASGVRLYGSMSSGRPTFMFLDITG